MPMNRYLEQYKAKQCTVDDALAAIRDGDFVATSGGVNAPLLFYKNLHRIAPRLREGFDFFYGTTYKKGDFEFLDSVECKEKIHTLSGFVLSGDEREYIRQGHVDYVPTHYHSQGSKMIQARGGLDVYVAAVCPMDERTGYFRTSLSNVNETDFRNAAKKIYLEVVPSLPVIYGNNEIHISEVEGIYEYDHPLETMDPLPFGEVEKQIGEYVAELVEDGSTIQLGIGAIPDAVAHAFLDKKDLGVHTEMITNSILELVEAGAVNGRKKSINRGIIVGAFSRGSQRLYDFMDHNPCVAMNPCSYVNNPHVIARNYKMVSVNTAMGIDLLGQVSSESIGPMQYSGSGGQVDTVTGAIHATGGKSIIALASTAKNGTLSKICLSHAPGTAVTLSRNDVDYVATEYGIVRLSGRTVKERAKLLISIAHPRFRDELTAQAKSMGFLL